LDAGEQYWLKLETAILFTDQLILTVQPSPPCPPNDICENTTMVKVGDSIPGDVSASTNDELWYKITDLGPSTGAVTVSTCTGTELLSEFLVYQGSDCINLFSIDGFYCLGSPGGVITFVPTENIIYWNAVRGQRNFILTITSTPNYLSLIDAKTDSIVKVLDGNFQRFDYQFDLRSSQLNIQATVSKDTPVKSVRVTFDRPKRSFCERKTPYSVFGDSNGNFFIATIPLGSHLVTATPYTGSGCTGNAGVPLQQEFKVTRCCPLYQVYDVSLKQYGFYIAADDSFSNLPCKVNIFADVSCAFAEAVTLVLRNRITNKIVHERKERSAPYFLFGNRNDNVFAGSIAAVSRPALMEH
jgi:hypothetical protein